MQHLQAGYSPQTEDIPFTLKYFDCDPNLALFVTADCITHLSSDVKNKIGKFEEVFDKCKNFLSIDVSNTGTSSLRRSKKKVGANFNKEATARFYTPSVSEEPAARYTPTTNTASELDGPTCSSSGAVGNMNRSTDNFSKTNNSDNNDYFIQAIENHEQSLERQRTQQQLGQAPTSILKHTRSTAGTSASAAGSTAAMHTSYKSTQEPELIVINKEDIKESTKNESAVIVLEKNQSGEMDLVDLLGNKWPAVAGETAKILNNTNTMTTTSSINRQNNVVPPQYGTTSYGDAVGKTARVERNKSPNPLTHFQTNKVNHSYRDVSATASDIIVPTTSSTGVLKIIY